VINSTAPRISIPGWDLNALRHSAPDIDPRLGLECFESRRASLPPGTQYEGIEKLAENRLTIKVMNGVAVETLACELNPDGTLQSTGK
jgi:hypothetical protein